MPGALLKYTNNTPVPSVLTLVEGNTLRVKLEGVSKSHPLQAKVDQANVVAVGKVVLHAPRVKVERMIADNPVEELRRLEDAINALRLSVDDMLSSSELDLTGEGREVIEAYRLFAYDQGWRQRMRDAVRTGLTAEAAVERVQDETRLRVQRLGDPILRERAHDLDDLTRRLIRHLTGDGVVMETLPKNSVLVARATLAVSSLSVGEYVGWLFLASAPVAIAIVILRGQSAEPIAQVLYDAEHVAESRSSAPVADRRG